MDTQRNKSVAARFWISAETEAMIQRIAATEGRSASSVYREMLDRGLASAGYASDTQNMQQLVREAIQEELKPHVERLASISAKGTQLSAAAFFLSAYIGRLQMSGGYLEEYDEIARAARKLGIEYLKLSKDRNLDDFIHDGLNRMQHYE